MLIAQASLSVAPTHGLEDIQSFRFRRYLFAMQGAFDLGKRRETFFNALPRFLQRARKGRLDGELTKNRVVYRASAPTVLSYALFNPQGSYVFSPYASSGIAAGAVVLHGGPSGSGIVAAVVPSGKRRPQTTELLSIKNLARRKVVKAEIAEAIADGMIRPRLSVTKVKSQRWRQRQRRGCHRRAPHLPSDQGHPRS